MSIKLINDVFNDAALTANQTLIMLALADNANDDGVCYPHQQTLIDKTKLSRTTVVRNLSELEAKGVIRKRYRAKKQGGRYSNIYLLYPAENLQKLDEIFAGFFEDEAEPKSTSGHPNRGSQSPRAGTQTGSQSLPAGTQATVYREPSLSIEPSQKKKNKQKKEVHYPEPLRNWIEYRKQIGKPIKPITIERLRQQHDADPDAFVQKVNHSIDNGYQGLFAPKPPRSGGYHQPEPGSLAWYDQQSSGVIPAGDVTDVEVLP